jgi:hypothetical protein
MMVEHLSPDLTPNMMFIDVGVSPKKKRNKIIYNKHVN